MKRLTMTTHKTPKLGTTIKDLSKHKGSPCLQCLVDSACTKSFINKSACYEFAEFVQILMDKKGSEMNEN